MMETLAANGDIEEKELSEVRDVVLRWLTRNCSSNVELASLSNVCRSWRGAIRTAILSACEQASLASSPSEWAPLCKLLLPSMLLTAWEGHREERDGPTAEPTFCLAWFHPGGLLTQQVPLEETYEDFEDAGDYSYDGARTNAELGRYTYHGSPSAFHRRPPAADADATVHAASEPFVPSSAVRSVAESEDESTPPPPSSSARQSHMPPSQVSSSPGADAVPPQLSVSFSDVRRCLSSSPHRLRHPRFPPGPWTDTGHSLTLQRMARTASANAPSSHLLSPSSPGGGHANLDNDVPRTQECTYQWTGYSQSHEVLLPFGYSPAFVQDILGEALTNPDNGASDVGRGVSEPSSSHAVRGATLARPDGYCLCWDDVDKAVEWASAINDVLPSEQHSSPGSPLSPEDIRRRQQRLLHMNRLRRELRRKRRERLRELLPRVVRTPESKDFHRHQTEHVRGRRPPEDAATQPCVQFLNVDRSRAVRFRTPPFQCGTTRSPITIFCVAIATEDGCFLSGIQLQMELGHMYPPTARDKLIDRSPVCIAMSIGKEEEPLQSQGKSAEWRDGSRETELPTAPLPTPLLRAGSRRRMRSFDSDSTEDSEQSMGDDGIQCSCMFHDVGDGTTGSSPFMTRTMSGGTDPMYEKGNSLVVRGALGPGQWHCYTAVLDGINSQLRIDGVDEPVGLGSEDSASNVELSNKNFFSELDGITLGSDHTFDMSLCLGEGDDGEGEGAIAEVAVFKGRMDRSDVEHLEQYLMRKHGIRKERSNDKESLDRWQDDEWRRQAQALMDVPATATKLTIAAELGTAASIPLRYAARTRSVSWNRTNEVTGKVTEVGRIGTARGSGRDESDW